MSLYYIITATVFTILSFVYILYKFVLKKSKIVIILSKVLCLVFTIAFTIRYLSKEIILVNTTNLVNNSPFGTNGADLMLYSMIMIWISFGMIVITQLSWFFNDNVSIIKQIMKWVVTPVFIIDFLSINILITAMYGVECANAISFPGISYSIELGIGLSICLTYWVTYYNPKVKFKEIIELLLCVITIIMVAIPKYAPQVLIGPGKYGTRLDDLNELHRLALYLMFIVPLLIVINLYNKTYQQKRFALLFFSLATMITYSTQYHFEDFLDLQAYPFHLCNLAMYLIPLCLLFKSNYIYYFTFFINVIGAAFAAFMPDLSETAYVFSEENMRFFINHYCAFFMPVVIMLLKLYPRPKMKMMLYTAIGFGIYFLTVLFVNAYFGSIGISTDFFFINSDFVASKIGAEGLRNFRLEIPTSWGGVMRFFPLYQALYFLVYIALSFGMWFVYELMFMVQDKIEDLFVKNTAINLKIKNLKISMKGRKMEEPLHMNNQNKLILNHFSKKYSTSNVFAVEDANLEIHGGEIFGFLGPNGAGKSTIIKSMVGIQSITSGSIDVCGYDMERQSVSAKYQIGFVPDHYALYENLTGREYVNYFANLYNVSEKDRNERIDDFVKRFNLEGSFENPIKTYSHGMKQKIAIMSALVHNPKVWILDEPLTGLDPDSIFQVKEAMKEHAKKGNIVFFSSHIIDVVERICDRIAIIKNGHIIANENLKDLESKGIVLEDYYKNTIEQSKVERRIDDSSKTKVKKEN